MWFERIDHENSDGQLIGPYLVHRVEKHLKRLRLSDVVLEHARTFCTDLVAETSRFVAVSAAAARDIERWKGVAYQSRTRLLLSHTPLYWSRLAIDRILPWLKAVGLHVCRVGRAIATSSPLPSPHARVDGLVDQWPTYDSLDIDRDTTATFAHLLRLPRVPSSRHSVPSPTQMANRNIRQLKRVRGATSIYVGGLHLCLEGLSLLLKELEEKLEGEGEAMEGEARFLLEQGIVQYIHDSYEELRRMLVELVCDNTAALAQRRRPHLSLDDVLVPSIHADLRASLHSSSSSCLAQFAAANAEAATLPKATKLRLYEERAAMMRQSLVLVGRQKAHMTQLGRVMGQLSHQSATACQYRESRWLSWTVLAVGVAAGLTLWYRHGVAAMAAAGKQVGNDLWDGSVRFAQNQLVLPLRKVYRNVRYDEASLSTINRAAVHSEELVLGVMVREFLQDTSDISEEQVRMLEGLAVSGDISSILPLYASAIRHPIKEALFGSLLRLVLIQVHKVKLDAEKISVVIDQLLRSNELLFQVTAMTPGLLVLAVLCYQGLGFFYATPSNSKLHVSLRANLRIVEIILNRYNEQRFLQADESLTQPVVSQQDIGQIVIAVSAMLDVARWLPQGQRVVFVKDCLQLVDNQLTITQRMAVLQRIFHTHAFLQDW